MRIRALAVALAALSFAVAAEQATNNPTPEIIALVQQLDDEDFDTRESATRKLEDRGEFIVQQLKQMRKRTDSLETRARLKELIWISDPPLVAVVARSEIRASIEDTQRAYYVLSGQMSQSCNEGELSYSWRQVAGPPVVMRVDREGARACVRTSSCVPGEYRFELVVSQGRKKSKPAPVKLIVPEPRIVSEVVHVPANDARFLQALVEEDEQNRASVRKIERKLPKGEDEPEE